MRARRSRYYPVMLERLVRRDFDRAFFRRYYHDASTAVVHLGEAQRRVRFVLAYLDFLGVEVKSVLDAGCGVGLWRRALRRIDRSIAYTGIDTSEYLCRRYGWTRASITEFRSRRKFDLVVCQDMLQYLDGDELRLAVDRVARLCRGACYVEVPTREDFAERTLDLVRTDRRIHLRGVRFYRRLLAEHFIAAGGGIFLPRNARTTILALERG
ncbi:MAG: class I SAM-dependent methyltransferase [Candidatus Krumholzibacteria bacterium]|nr:class I SAM-dependent methyltransferase [Candidatus Krumholzibacteria bacterium]